MSCCVLVVDSGKGRDHWDRLSRPRCEQATPFSLSDSVIRKTDSRSLDLLGWNTTRHLRVVARGTCQETLQRHVVHRFGILLRALRLGAVSQFEVEWIRSCCCTASEDWSKGTLLSTEEPPVSRKWAWLLELQNLRSTDYFQSGFEVHIVPVIVKNQFTGFPNTWYSLCCYLHYMALARLIAVVHISPDFS